MAEKVKMLIPEEEVNARIEELGKKISEEYAGKQVHLICVLKGGVFFMCELAKDCSEYDTLEAFKESIRKNNQEQLDKQDDLAVENALVDQVIESMEAEIPQAMYDARMDEMVNDFAFRVEQQGLRLEDYLKYMGQTVEQFRASFMPQAEKQVKIRLALEAVAAAENIEASEEEVSAEIKRIADQYKMEEDKVRELVNVEDLKKDLAVNKAIDFIKSHANVVEKAAEAEKTEDAE